MDLDEMMNRFRLASRELFNNYFKIWNPHESANIGWEMEEYHREVEMVLFQNLVTEPASLETIKYGNVQPEIRVVLRHGESCNIMINREINSGYWDGPLKKITKDAQLAFLRFFDWDWLDYRDYKYAHVIIKDWPSHPEANGKHALIETRFVKFTKQTS